MTTSDTHSVLGLFDAGPPAFLHTSGEVAQASSSSVTKKGHCHSLPIGQAVSAASGVNLQNTAIHNSILPGEVVH